MKVKDTISIKPIRKQTVPEQIIHELKALIDSGQIVPGSKLPGERELAEMLNVSRPSLREALRALSLLGVLENRHGSGTYLSASTERWPSEPFSILLSIKKGALLDIFEARKSLEGAVAAFASRRRSEEDLHAMGEALEGMRANLGSPQKYAEQELQFDRAVVEAAKNPVISDLMEKIYRLFMHSRDRVYRYVSETRRFLAEDLRNHETIFKSIQEGNEQKATKAMNDHLHLFEQRLRDEQNRRNR